MLEHLVEATISRPSTNLQVLVERLTHLDNTVNIAALSTAAHALPAEAGEFSEIVKKMMYQGKEPTEDVIFHLKRELGDVLYYTQLACMALDTTMEEVVNINIDKLRSRYPNGFEVQRSEIREASDI